MRRCVLLLVVAGAIAHTICAPLAFGQSSPTSDLQQDAETARRALDMFLRQQKVLFRKGELELELSTFYSTDERDALVRADSGRALARIESRSVEAALIARYGLLDDLELDLRIPFVYAEQEVHGGLTDTRTDDEGLGDIAAGAKYQIWHETGGTPDVVLFVDFRTPSGQEPLLGTGHWHVGGGISLVKTFDPVVLFARVGYIAPIDTDGRNPGDEIFYQAGIGYSLNDRVSFNMQVVGAFVRDATLNNRTVNDSNLELVSMQFGVTVLATKRLFVEPVVNFGLTKDAPDLILGINLPFRF
jgi:hypothetical protein